MIDESSRPGRPLVYSFLIAIFIEAIFILMTGVHFKWQKAKIQTTDTPSTIEVVTLPDEVPKLKSAAAPSFSASEETLSEKPSQDSSVKSSLAPPSNQIQAGAPQAATHGPILVESPSPVIPDYLKDRDLSTKVLIEFTVAPSGESEPRLLVSSGDEELDQVAIQTAKKWKFYPAEKDHLPTLSKVRLRILFTVK